MPIVNHSPKMALHWIVKLELNQFGQTCKLFSVALKNRIQIIFQELVVQYSRQARKIINYGAEQTNPRIGLAMSAHQ